VVVHVGGLSRCEVVVGRILHAQVWTPEEIGIHGGDVRKAGVTIAPLADRRCGQLGETHHEVIVRFRIVVAPAGLPRPADVLVPQPAEREAELLVGESMVDGYLEVAPVCQDGGPLRRTAHDGQSERQRKGHCEPYPSSRRPCPAHARDGTTTSSPRLGPRVECVLVFAGGPTGRNWRLSTTCSTSQLESVSRYVIRRRILLVSGSLSGAHTR